MTLCFANTSGPQRALVRSHNVALAPFSQNSAAAGFGGFDHAQEVHIVPPGLLRCASVSNAPGPAFATRSTARIPSADPQPPTGLP